MIRRILAFLLLFMAIAVLCIPVMMLTPQGSQIVDNAWERIVPGSLSPTPLPVTPTPIPTPKPVLTAKGQHPTIAARAAYLLDSDTGNVLVQINATQPRPMASTTKIMTALIAIQTGDLTQKITIKQSTLNLVLPDSSSAYLAAGDTLSLKELLYGMMLPSGDDAAMVIAQALGGSVENFVQRMNLFAYRLRLFQTHYTNPDGLTPAGDDDHYTSASDLARLTSYAMSIPLFAQIVQTKTYTLKATDQHHAYTWSTTNTLLTSYKGMVGVKTGHTDAAGYCLVFEAIRSDHRLIGVVLNSPSEEQRNKDVEELLNWGFALPLLPPV